MNIQSIILLSIIMSWLIGSLFYMHKHRGKGGCQSCSGNCSECTKKR